MNKVMLDGKKSTAEKIVYGAFEIINKKTNNDPLKFFHDSIEKIKPSLIFSKYTSMAEEKIASFLSIPESKV